MGIRVFWSEPTGRYRADLRRYSGKNAGPCPLMPGDWSYHNASVALGEIEAPEYPASRSWSGKRCDDPSCTDCPRPWDLDVAQDDPRWPAACACGYVFTIYDEWQVNYHQLYVAKTTGAVPAGTTFTLHDPPVGAMWDATRMRAEMWRGPDGIALCVQTPGGTWHVDGEASNCTRTQFGPKEIDGRQYEKVWLGRSHYCWVRHGDPRTGMVHVDKTGDTCAAGSGSILLGGYHGFLHNGELTNA